VLGDALICLGVITRTTAQVMLIAKVISVVLRGQCVCGGVNGGRLQPLRYVVACRVGAQGCHAQVRCSDAVHCLAGCAECCVLAGSAARDIQLCEAVVVIMTLNCACIAISGWQLWVMTER
jgi:hypothetical protein